MKKTISGIRGVFGDDFGLKDAMRYCGNFSQLAGSGRCVVGRDTRESGRMVMEAAKAALMANGVDVYDLGMAPTPVVFREARRYGAGVVVTASHNPASWNGLKFIVDGRGVNEGELPRILEGRGSRKPGIGGEERATSAYLEEAAELIGDIPDAPEVVVDLGGGAARDFAPALLGRLGCGVSTINDSLRGCGRGPDPTSDGLAGLAAASRGKDVGFAFDLDGDRLVVVRGGEKQAPDVTLGLGIAKSLDLGCRKFVLSIDSSVAIEKFVTERGGSVQRSKVGEANVIELMLGSGADAGGEGSSAGFVLPGFNYCRDGILTGGLIASMMGGAGFDEVLDHMGGYHQVRRKVEVGSGYHDAVIEKILEGSAEFSDVDTLDGVKGIIDEDSWVLIRKSNTEDAIRVSGESGSREACEGHVEDAVRLVNRCYEQVR